MRLFVYPLLLVSMCSNAQEPFAVTHVFDGDTVTLTHAAGNIRLRLADIDAPERQQPFGQNARRALIALCKGSGINIEVTLTGMDQYQRHLGRLKCNQTDASLFMAEQGLAWFNEKYSDNAAVKYAAANARNAGIGLWSEKNAMPPWVWRRLDVNHNYSTSQPVR